MGKSKNVERHRIAAGRRLYLQYFSPDPLYDARHFRRRFRISSAVYDMVMQKLVGHDLFFLQKKDCTGKPGFTSHQKATAALRMLAYGICADALDDSLAMSATVVQQSLDHFCESVNECFAATYLRSPTTQDLKQLLKQSSQQGFPGMLGSIDCCKWTWKKCPVAWHGQFEGKESEPTCSAMRAFTQLVLGYWSFGSPSVVA